MPDFRALVAAMQPELIELRHDLHRFPELGYDVQRTSQRILGELEKIDGLQIRCGIADTGMVATLNAERDGPCVALRSDMDALPITEINTFDYKSTHVGRMHACGHDGHMTCLVGAARVLAECRQDLPGKVKFIFQPAEEKGCGGKRMVEEGALRDPDVDASFALHGWPETPLGKIMVGTGPVLAAASAFSIDLHGAGSHAAYPHQGQDAILAASNLIGKMQAVVSRFRDPVDPAVVSICAIHAGDTYNVLPGHARMLGTLRALRQETHDASIEHLKRLVAATGSEFQLEATFELVESYPSLVNDEKAAKIAQEAATGFLGADQVITNPVPSMGAEDFAFYARAVPSAMWRLGLCPPNRDDYPKLHQADFDFPDAAIPLGVEMHSRIAYRFLSTGGWNRS